MASGLCQTILLMIAAPSGGTVSQPGGESNIGRARDLNSIGDDREELQFARNVRITGMAFGSGSSF
jgi:hypothetical protein